MNNRILQTLSEEDIETEITSTDEYMYDLDCKIRQTENFKEKSLSCKPFNANTEKFTPNTEINDHNVNTSTHVTLLVSIV